MKSIVVGLALFGMLMIQDADGNPQVYTVNPSPGGGTQVMDVTGNNAGRITNISPSSPGSNSGIVWDSNGNSGTYIYTPGANDYPQQYRGGRRY